MASEATTALVGGGEAADRSRDIRARCFERQYAVHVRRQLSAYRWRGGDVRARSHHGRGRSVGFIGILRGGRMEIVLAGGDRVIAGTRAGR